MRILYVVHQYLPRHQAGVEIYAHSLASEISRHHEVAIYCREPAMSPAEDTHRDEIMDGVWVRRIAGEGAQTPTGQFLSDFCNRRVAEAYGLALDAYQPDLVHVQHLKGLSATMLGETARRGIPVVMTLHDYWALCPNAQFVRPSQRICPGWRAGVACGICAMHHLGRPQLSALSPLMSPLFWLRQGVIRRQMRHVEGFICPSQFLRDQYVRAGYPAKRFQILENGLDLSPLADARSERTTPVGHYAYIGSLAWQKGVHTLVEAFRTMPAAAELRIWGETRTFPDYVDRLREQIEGHGNIHLEGRLAREGIGAALAWADYLIVPSLWWENSPTVILEANAAGVPVIASRLGAMQEKVTDGISGLLFEAGDVQDLIRTLRRTLEEPDLWQSLRAGLPQVIGMPEHALQIESIYNTVCKRDPGRDDL